MPKERAIRASMILPALALALAGCGGEAPSAGLVPADLSGEWRAVLTSPGGELPFTLRITATEAGGLAAVAVNGEEHAPSSGVTLDGRSVELAFDWYDSEIRAEVDAAGNRMTGRWRKTVPAGDTVMPFSAARGAADERFPVIASGEAPSSAAPASVAGAWSMEFTDEDGTEPGRGELRQEGRRVTGTILTPTGDYRFLEGAYDGGLLRLSTFDGAHAFLFQARARGDGTLAGDFWSRETYHATWTARPAAEGEEDLPDAWSLVGLESDDGRLRFSFPDLEGRPVSLDDRRFAGKVVLVNLFGSWCPNCNDEAPLLAAWHRRYGARGLELVGLAYEFTGDPERDRRQVRRYAERHGLEFPLLLAGVSDKAKAAETLPDLTSVVAYPTSIFVGRDGRVRKIHSGFSGPGTGAHYEALVAEIESLLESLLAEPGPGA